MGPIKHSQTQCKQQYRHQLYTHVQFQMVLYDLLFLLEELILLGTATLFVVLIVITGSLTRLLLLMVAGIVTIVQETKVYIIVIDHSVRLRFLLIHHIEPLVLFISCILVQFFEIIVVVARIASIVTSKLLGFRSLDLTPTRGQVWIV